MPVLLAIALHAEARPVIERFRLKQDASFRTARLLAG